MLVPVFMAKIRKNEMACKDQKVSTRRKRNTNQNSKGPKVSRRRKRNTQMTAECEEEATISSSSKSYTVQIRREPTDLTALSTSVCKDSLAGSDLLQLDEDYTSYDGSK
jgi:hypothetical protein